MAIDGFYWLDAGLLAGCSRPGGRSFAPADPAALERDLSWLCEQGIGAVLSLTETPLDADALARHNLAYLHVPIPDHTPPTPEELERALAFIDRQHYAGRAVVVHCLMGQGRTGTVLAAYRIRSGAKPEDALVELRAICPGAVTAPSQEQALLAYHRGRDWII